jgi:hypothetical protein
MWNERGGQGGTSIRAALQSKKMKKPERMFDPFRFCGRV